MVSQYTTRSPLPRRILLPRRDVVIGGPPAVAAAAVAAANVNSDDDGESDEEGQGDLVDSPFETEFEQKVRPWLTSCSQFQPSCNAPFSLTSCNIYLIQVFECLQLLISSIRNNCELISNEVSGRAQHVEAQEVAFNNDKIRRVGLMRC